MYELWDGETGNLIGAYASEQEALAATPARARCGWRPEAIFIRVAEDWGQYGPNDGDGA